MYQYKMMLEQELSERDQENHSVLCVEIWHVPRAALMFFSHEAHFHLCGSVKKQDFLYLFPTKIKNLWIARTPFA